MGTEKESMIELTERIGRKTGGVSVSPFVSSIKSSPEPVAYLMVSVWMSRVTKADRGVKGGGVGTSASKALLSL